MTTENITCMGCSVNKFWVDTFHQPPLFSYPYPPQPIDFGPAPSFSPIDLNLDKKALYSLKSEEKDILFKLATAWEDYCKIETKESNLHEFNDAIHRCQQLIALRVARRVDPEIWSK